MTFRAEEQAWHNAEKLGGDQSKYFSIGGSAGGGLAIGLALKIIDAGARSHISGVVAMAPVTAHYKHVPAEYKTSFKAWEENKVDVPVIDRAVMETFYGK